MMLSLAVAQDQPPIIYEGRSTVSTDADGRLRPAVGANNIQVYRSNRSAPDHRDYLTDTYLHAPMIAYWNGLFHLNYLSAPINEHDEHTTTSYTTSKDGLHWETPRLLFPAYRLPNGQLTLNHQRASFYVAPDGRLLTTAFYGRHPNPTDGTGIGRAVREIKKNGNVGPDLFHSLQLP